MSENKAVDLPGHLKTAWLHIQPSTSATLYIPTDDDFKKIADYICKNCQEFEKARQYGGAYNTLKNAINDALDTRDGRGTKLRDFIFDSDGYVKEVKDILINGLDSAEDFL